MFIQYLYNCRTSSGLVSVPDPPKTDGSVGSCRCVLYGVGLVAHLYGEVQFSSVHFDLITQECCISNRPVAHKRKYAWNV